MNRDTPVTSRAELISRINERAAHRALLYVLSALRDMRTRELIDRLPRNISRSSPIP